MASQMLFAPDTTSFISGNCAGQSVPAERITFRPVTARGNQLRCFPARLKSDPCWKPDDFKEHAEEYILTLDQEDIAAIEEAVTDFKNRRLDLSFLEPSTFRLPEKLTRRLRRVSKAVHSGIGFAVLRGLNPEKYNDTDNVIAYLGITSHIGVQRSTNTKGNAMDHIRDASRDLKPKARAAVQELAPSKLADGMKFHADRLYADILSLYVKSQAPIGGEQYISSFWTIYNELMEHDPDVLQTLAEDWQWAVSDKPEQSAPDRMPAMLHADGRVIFQMVWQPFVKNPELLSTEQLRALGTLQRIAEKNSIKLDHQPGDIQLINNLAILHTRSKFKDSSSQQRHLLRLGLRDPTEAWKLPDQYAALFENAFKTPMDKQMIPVTDFDAWDKTTTEDLNHG